MSAGREQQFKDLVAEFPDSPMGYFSLGKYYLDEKDYRQSASCFEQAVKLDPEYAAALVALGDAYAQLGLPNEAREVYEKARNTKHGKRDASLGADIDARIAGL
jgi:tetratricopeptide (TPR) repeat protein